MVTEQLRIQIWNLLLKWCEEFVPDCLSWHPQRTVLYPPEICSLELINNQLPKPERNKPAWGPREDAHH